MKLIENLKGQRVHLPSTMTFVVQGDTVAYDFDDSDYKIFTYVDSIGCSTCKMNLKGWEQFLAEINNNQNSSVKLVMIVNTKDVAELNRHLKKYHFNYPISIDDKNQVKSMNIIPEDFSFQTFLLDDNNKIIAVGNPLIYSDVKKQYEQELGIKKSQHDLSEMTISPKHLALGVFSDGEEKLSKFRLFNNSNKPIKIREITTSCSCTSAWSDYDSIIPNGYLDIHVKCVPQKNDGFFVRHINVLLNDNRNINISISGIMEIED